MLDNLEQHGRCDSLRIIGIHENPDHDDTDGDCSVCVNRSKLIYPLSPETLLCNTEWKKRREDDQDKYLWNLRPGISENVYLKPEQLWKPLTRKTWTTRTPAFWGYPRRLMITHTIESCWIPSEKKTKSKYNFETGITRETPSWLLDKMCNMKWIQWVLLKIQSGHDSVHRRTDGQGELRWSWGGGGGGGVVVNEEVPDIYINDDLTQFRVGLVRDARSLKTNNKINDTWTIYGKAMIKDNHGHLKTITKPDDVIEFANW